MPETDYWATAYGMSPSLAEELSNGLEKVGRDMVDDVVRGRGGASADIPVEVHAIGGSPGHVLVEQSRDADLLVVGHRGRGGFRSALLGSVGLQCVVHAYVPVTVVRPGRRRARTERVPRGRRAHDRSATGADGTRAERAERP